MKDVSIVIKTFERKKDLTRLLNSIEKYYPTLPVIIVDDSKKNYKDFICNKFKKLNLTYLVEDYDIGLSKGRNILVNNVKTKYFLLCDDDFEFDERTNIEQARKILIENNGDIVGGIYYNRFRFDSLYSILWTLKDLNRFKKVLHKEEFINIYNGKFEINNNKIKLIVDKNFDNYSKEIYYDTEICTNIFLAKTDSIKKINGWTPEMLKVGEHEFFFLKAKKNKLKVMFSKTLGVRHYPKKTLNYVGFRMRAEDLFKKACKLEKFESFEIYDPSKGQNIWEYFSDEVEKK